MKSLCKYVTHYYWEVPSKRTPEYGRQYSISLRFGPFGSWTAVAGRVFSFQYRSSLAQEPSIIMDIVDLEVIKLMGLSVNSPPQSSDEARSE
jgi:hypothetical protein